VRTLDKLAASPDHGWKILTVADDVSMCTLIRTLLQAMGCKCSTAANEEQALAQIEREPFDALLVFAHKSEAFAEDLILSVRETCSELWQKILVISGGAEEQKVRSLVERYGLFCVPQEQLIQQLWPALQLALTSRRRLSGRRLLAGLANIVFDSFQLAQPAYVRGARQLVRQLAYRYIDVMIDLQIEALPSLDRVSITGQVLNSMGPLGWDDGLIVLAMSGQQTIARAITDRFGEFTLEFDFVENLGIEVQIGPVLWVSVPVGNMNWARKQAAGSQSGN
jgi:CheY-like chemotaxis protein